MTASTNAEEAPAGAVVATASVSARADRDNGALLFRIRVVVDGGVKVRLAWDFMADTISRTVDLRPDKDLEKSSIT